MKKAQIFQLLALCAFFVFGACHKHDDDTTDPVLTISAPVADASLSGNVAIAGSVTDEESLHELTITVTKDSDGSEQFKKTPEVHDLTTYLINESWTPSGITAETAVTLTVVAVDHGDNTVTKTVKFKVKP